MLSSRVPKAPAQVREAEAWDLHVLFAHISAFARQTPKHSCFTTDLDITAHCQLQLLLQLSIITL
jgi:hypothetical protein